MTNTNETKLATYYVFDENFSDAKKYLDKDGFKVATLEQVAKLRMQRGRNDDISKCGLWTAEDFIILPNKVCITKNSIIMRNAEKATLSHIQSKEYCLNKKQVDYALANAVQVKDYRIPTNRFGENELTKFCFGKSAQEYGQFLKDAGIEELAIFICGGSSFYGGISERDIGYFDCDYGKPVARKVWFREIGGRYGSKSEITRRNFLSNNINTLLVGVRKWKTK